MRGLPRRRAQGHLKGTATIDRGEREQPNDVDDLFSTARATSSSPSPPRCSGSDASAGRARLPRPLPEPARHDAARHGGRGAPGRLALRPGQGRHGPEPLRSTAVAECSRCRRRRGRRRALREHLQAEERYMKLLYAYSGSPRRRRRQLGSTVDRVLNTRPAWSATKNARGSHRDDRRFGAAPDRVDARRRGFSRASEAKTSRTRAESDCQSWRAVFVSSASSWNRQLRASPARVSRLAA